MDQRRDPCGHRIFDVQLGECRVMLIVDVLQQAMDRRGRILLFALKLAHKGFVAATDK